MSPATLDSFDAGVLQDLVQPLGLPGALLDLRLAVAGQVAQLTDRLGWHEAGAHQAVLDQLADPLGIGDVGLAAGHVAQVAGIQQPARQRVLQHVVDAPPVHPGRLHADQAHLLSDQPVPQRQQLHGGGPKRADLLGPLPIRAGGAHAGHHRVLVHVQPGAARHDDVHRSSFTSARASGRPEEPHLTESEVRARSNSSTLPRLPRSDLSTGWGAPRSSRRRRAAQHSFHPLHAAHQGQGDLTGLGGWVYTVCGCVALLAAQCDGRTA
jgi:hypothetical protein